jgi:DNA-binding winged helix-turn-helix (wHTH) protein/tetratricopeptide (TPR) repeat protein
VLRCFSARNLGLNRMSTSRYRFGPFDLDPIKGELCRNGARVKLQDLPYRLLLMLLERPGEIITRDEVRQRLWPENTFVEFDNSLGVAIRKVRESLGDEADSPRYVETIPRRGYRFLAPVRTEPTSTVEPIEAVPPSLQLQNNNLEAGGPTLQPSQSASRTGRRRYWPIPVTVAILVGAALYLSHSASRQAPNAVEARNLTSIRRSVAVLGFRNLPGRAEDNWLSSAFAEMLNTELATGGRLRLVSGEDVAQAKRDLPLTDEDSLARTTLARLRTNPGADVVVLGSYTLIPGDGGKRIRMDVRLQDTARGDTIVEQAFTGSERDLFEMANEAGRVLRQALNVASISPQGNSEVRAALPSSENAMRLYTEGQAKLWAFDFLGARDAFIKAIAADPKYPLAHAGLSEVWYHLGFVAKSEAEAKTALALSEHLPEEQRLLLEGRYRSAINDNAKAVETYRDLFSKFPDSLAYGLSLADAQRWVSPDDALRTLEMLRQLPAPAGNDARIDLLEARALMDKDKPKSEAAAQRAIQKGTAQGSHHLVARAYGVLCQAQVLGSSANDAIHYCETARQSYAADGDHYNEARTTNDLAAVYYQLGDSASAERMFRQAGKVFHAVGDISSEGAIFNNLGDIYLDQGNLVEAQKLLQKALTVSKAVDDKAGSALILNDLAELLRREGKLEAALTTFHQAQATAQEVENKSALGYVLSGIGDVLSDRGDLTSARKSYEEALALRNATGEKQSIAETQVVLARLATEEGRLTEAEASLRKCKDQFHQDAQADDEILASAALIQVLLKERNLSAAKSEAEATAALAAKTQNRYARLEFDLQNAQVQISSDNLQSAREALATLLKDARAHALLGVELQTQLAQAELELKSGQAAAAREELITLERSAHSAGFGLIGNRASALRTGQKKDSPPS